MHKFFKNFGDIYLQASEEQHEASCILSVHKF